MEILNVKHLEKSFGSKTVLNGICFSMKAGEIVGFVGRNGTGKTTTMKCITGLLKANGGKIQICDYTVTYGGKIPTGLIGYLQDVPEFYGYMTAGEYLRYCAQLLCMKRKQIKLRVAELLDMVGLSESKGKISTFSRGMKQRLGLAQAILNSPQLLVCDEPTSALDPQGRRELLNLLQTISHTENVSVLLSTHVLSDVERICDKVIILDQGKILYDGTINEIKKKYMTQQYEIEFHNRQQLMQFSKCFDTVQDVEILAQGELLKISVADMDNFEKIAFMLIWKNHYKIRRFEIVEPDLESIFMQEINK